MNERIRAREVRVIGDEGEQIGVMPPFEALKMARERNLDLVEISPTAQPPVCRIMDYGKFLYQNEKREREAKKKQKTITVKEVDRKSTRLNSSHSLHDALPISNRATSGLPHHGLREIPVPERKARARSQEKTEDHYGQRSRSEEHTSELQSLPTRCSSDLQPRNLRFAASWTTGNSCTRTKSASAKPRKNRRPLRSKK